MYLDLMIGWLSIAVVVLIARRDYREHPILKQQPTTRPGAHAPGRLSREFQISDFRFQIKKRAEPALRSKASKVRHPKSEI